MAKETTLADFFTRRGAWWLPGTPDARVPGTLTHDPAVEIKLDLDGAFHREAPKGPFVHLHAPAILGETLDGKCCTMVDAHESNYQMNAPDLQAGGDQPAVRNPSPHALRRRPLRGDCAGGHIHGHRAALPELERKVQGRCDPKICGVLVLLGGLYLIYTVR